MCSTCYLQNYVPESVNYVTLSSQAEVQIYYKIQNDSCKLYGSKFVRRVDALGKNVHYCIINVYLYIGICI
jgi:hypothetical protein